MREKEAKKKLFVLHLLSGYIILVLNVSHFRGKLFSTRCEATATNNRREEKEKKQPHDLFSRVEQPGRATASHTNTLVTTVSPVLTNPMAPGGGLQVVLRVEVAVDEDDGVSGGEVQADSSCKRSQCFCVCVCAAACVTFTCCHALLVDLWCRLNHCTITHVHTQKSGNLCQEARFWFVCAGKQCRREPSASSCRSTYLSATSLNLHLYFFMYEEVCQPNPSLLFPSNHNKHP